MEKKLIVLQIGYSCGWKLKLLQGETFRNEILVDNFDIRVLRISFE